MPTSKRPRKAYRPKPIRLNAVDYALESVKPVAQHDGYLTELKMTNHSAMTELVQGRANQFHISILIGMSNMVEGLWRLGFGKEYEEVLVAGQAALKSLTDRAAQLGRYTPTGPEIVALNAYMELHDAQMEVVVVKDIERALDLAKRLSQSGNTTRLKKPAPQEA